MKKNNNEIDKIIREYFNIFEEDLGFSSIYVEDNDKKNNRKNENEF